MFLQHGTEFPDEGSGKKSFDKNGVLASRGEVDQNLLVDILSAYQGIQRERKSLGREFFEQAMQPLLENKSIALANRLRTVCESVAIEVAGALPSSMKNLKLLATGGGALNRFLVEVMQERLDGRARILLPAKEIIGFKEALIFGLLGVLKLRNEINVLSSVTGAVMDHSSGFIY